MHLPNLTARHLFLHHHALTEPRHGPAKGADLSALIDRIGFVQVDSITTVERAHHMILWARRHSYRPPALKPLLEQKRALFEHWTHDASIVPMALFPQWKHRFARDATRLHANWQRWFRDGYEAQFDTILNRIAAHGPVSSADVGEGEARGKGGWWDWHPSKTALEWLWRTGQISVTRRDAFRKVYDLTENVIPVEFRRAETSPEEHCDWACSTALANLGFADETEIARYWHAVDKPAVQDWARGEISAGRLIRITVEQADGSLRPALARPDLAARVQALPEAPTGLRILSPFDPALRDRARIERLFGFHYRIEVFVPEAKRQYGYYVFPVLEGTQLIGRIDAKADRTCATLRIRAFWPEPGIRHIKARHARLARELDRLAQFANCAACDYAADWQRAPLSPAR
ncbi:winged helix-turn-helix domain-containing protein [Pseudotabrizicola alkalilacus]|uniref:Winged helix-turn-helix domain-containing protein n=1 Tax=Pseudotabrizicola alkalilacus TaxID=2305252 RepID=A0A411YZL9_9RHOB|nr:crosslink repair DNA glycosylase YcaQ family protein [Pseudotabrizicola alkalilacus]RGP36259.1 winged helix-turn-helix domain-containing protein [Pseudotabrizicola alkalilacus]